MKILKTGMSKEFTVILNSRHFNLFLGTNGHLLKFKDCLLWNDIPPSIILYGTKYTFKRKQTLFNDKYVILDGAVHFVR